MQSDGAGYIQSYYDYGMYVDDDTPWNEATWLYETAKQRNNLSVTELITFGR